VQKIAKIKVKKSSNVSDLIDIAPTKKESRQNKRQIKRENRRKLKSNARTTS